MNPTVVDASAVITHLCKQLSDANYALAIATARAEQAEVERDAALAAHASGRAATGTADE